MKRSSSWTASDLKQIIFMRTSPKGGGRVLPNKRLMGMCYWMACIFTTGFTV